MTSHQQHDIETYLAQIGEMGEAVCKQDLDTLMSHYDDDCVFVNGLTGDVSPKSAIADSMRQTWATFPDFTPRLAASHLQENTLAAVLEATATVPGADGQVSPTGPKAQWLFMAFYTFDALTLKVVREVYYADEEAIGKKLEEAAARI